MGVQEETKQEPVMVAVNPLGLRVGKISSPVLNVMLQLIQAINQMGIFEILEINIIFGKGWLTVTE